MSTLLENPVHLNGKANSAQAAPPSSEPATPPAIHPSTETSPTSLPDSFDSEERLEFLYRFLNPNLDHFQVARNSGLKLSQYHAYVNSEEFQERLAQQTALSDIRAQACAKLAQPKAIATLENILDSYNDAEHNELVDDGRHPRIHTRRLRQRHRESARRAAWLLLRLTGAIPSHLRAAQPRAAANAERLSEFGERPTSPAKPSSAPQTASAHPSREQHPSDPDHPPFQLPVEQPSFAKREAEAKSLREIELNPDRATAQQARATLDAEITQLKIDLEARKSKILLQNSTETRVALTSASGLAHAAAQSALPPAAHSAAKPSHQKPKSHNRKASLQPAGP